MRTVCLIGVVYLLLGGCALIPKARTQAKWPLEKLIAQKQFLLARAKLDRQLTETGSETAHENWLKIIAKQEQAYVNQQIDLAEKLWSSKQYFSAKDRIARTINLVGEKRKLTNRLSYYEDKILLYQANLDIEQAISEANWIALQAKLQQRYKQLIKPGNFSKKDSLSLEEKQQALQASMFALGKKLLTQSQIDLGIQALMAATNLGHEPAAAYLKTYRKKQQLAKARSQNKKRKQQQQLQEAKLQAERSEIYEQLNNAIATNNLELGIEYVQIIDEKYPNDDYFSDLKKLLGENIQFRMNELFALGKNYYTLGSFAQALQIWTKILTIQPDNLEANNLRIRTEKVISNLEKLSEKPDNTQDDGGD